MEFVKKNIKWFVLGGLAVAFLGLFLPYATVTAEAFGVVVFNQSITYVEHDGLFVLLALVACGVAYFLKKEKYSLIPLGIGAGITLYSALNVSKVMGDIGYEGVKASFSIGFYMLILGLIVSVATICYSEFVLKKQGGMAMGYNNYNPNMQMPNQGYQQYGNNQTYQQPMQNGYGQQQPMMQNNYNNDFNVNNNSVAPQGVMPTANVDTNIFNQAPVAQVNPVMDNQVQPNMMNQPVMNTMPQQAPVQDFSSPATIVCPQCRSTLNSGMAFCNQCGSKLN